ncbi:phosphatase PAP2 family protein [Virgibacillus sp. 179-BFC.A HS]|uniref:Phosphatase PAP2 family protein n=1 Tax=Tigheibacillus jepli TaxID=3035914 RepID=A0ABU5CNM3_9BACI|nr:phosphatase PAP2 family protein [Virgibacillus sp. 179-BFC.A HS]MDY0407048.1 phosphatase PAP2 family protein [Virgibacillus sp. 179-BFC.A HS]
MNTRKIPVTPLFIIGLLFLILFGLIAFGVSGNRDWVRRFDMYWIDHIQGLASEGLTSFIKVFTELGDVRVVIVLTILIAAILFVKKRFADGLWFGGTILFCAVIIEMLLKKIFDRERPDIMQLISETGASFPSGHATATTIFYGFIGLVLVLSAKKLSAMIWTGLISFLLIVFILLSRVYLGVHYPTDVAAGFCYGMAAVFISIAAYALLQQPLRDFLNKVHLKDQSKPINEKRRRQYD